MNMRKLAKRFKRLKNSMEHRIRRWLLVFLLMLAQLFASPVTHADEMLEYQVKAAFIYNFIAFTQWPGSTDSAINLCLYGEDYFGNEIDKLQNKMVGARPIKVIRVSNSNQLPQCQAVFFSKSVNNNLADLINSLENYPILTLADTPNAISRGIIINMNLVNEKIVFEINLATARKSGLDISSKLLQLAAKVHQ
jgi:hypothetical protein